MPTINVNFTSQAIRDAYLAEDDNALKASLEKFRTAENITSVDKGEFSSESAALAAAKDQMTEVIKSLEQRFATFEGVTIAASEKINDNDYPFDRVALKREFMDEVLSALLRSNYGFDVSAYYFAPSNGADPPQPLTAPTKNSSGAQYGGFGELLIDAGSNYWERSTATTTKSWDHCNFAEIGCDGKKSDFEDELAAAYAPTGYKNYSPSYSTDTGNQTYTITYYVYTPAFPNFVADDFSSLYDYDIATGVETDNRPNLLNAEGQDIFARYSSLIDQIFLAGDAIQTAPVDLPEVVTSISGVEIAGVGTLTGLRTVMVSPPTDTNPDGVYEHWVFDETQGFDPATDPGARARQQVNKTQVENTANQPVDFELGFGPNELTNITYYRVDALDVDGGVRFERASSGQIETAPSTHHLSSMEYLYYWNEVRIRAFRGQLGFEQAVVTEIQEDLRQANAALAELEKAAGKADPGEGASLNSDKEPETSLLDHHQAIINHANLTLYGTSDSHNYSGWQANRVALKAYIDRRTSDAQSATLDYQQTLNRFNNAYEVMAKLQEKIDGLIKTQLRNW